MWRFLGWTVLCVAISILGAELLVFLETGGYAPLTLGQIWHNLGTASYVRAEDLIRGAVWAPLWDYGVVPVLALPASALLVLVAVIVFVVAARKRR